MGLTPKGHATRQRIIEGAATYLRSHDAGSATLDDLRAVTATSKSQLFHYFPAGKDELLLAVATYEADRVLADQEPALSDLSSWDGWQRWREVLVARYRAQGANCPLGALIAQAGATPGTREIVTTLLARWQARIREGVLALQAGALVDAGVDADRVAASFIAGIQGGVAVLRSTGRTDHLEAVFDVLFGYLRARPEDRDRTFRKVTIP